MFQHVVDTLSGKELVRVGRFTQTIKEQRQVVMVVQLLNFNLDWQGKQQPCYALPLLTQAIKGVSTRLVTT